MFVAEAARLGLTCARGPVGEQIQARVAAVADSMGVTEAAARREFGDDLIREMARSVAAVLAHEEPGADPTDLAPTHVVPTGVAGHSSAGLAIVAQLSITGDLSEIVDAHAEVHQAIALICM